MKVFVLLAALVAVATAEDLICKLGEVACKINCIASGHTHGHCDENGECDCTEPQPRSELICILGGNLACEINCLTSTGHFDGACTEENDCVCGHPETTSAPETRRRRSPPNRGDLACRHGGDDVCAAFCHWTTGKQEGFCDAGDNCHCEPKPSIHARADLACKSSIGGGDHVCAAFCHFTTGEEKGHCDKDGNCICG